MVPQPLDVVTARVTGFLNAFRKGRLKYANKTKAQKEAQLIFGSILNRTWLEGRKKKNKIKKHC